MLLRTKIPFRSSGIYIILSITNGKRYIGSAVNLRERKNLHFSELKRRHHNKHLQNHYNKYGKDDLYFGILEFCSKENLISREQYYLDFLSPEFNIDPIAGSRLGAKFTKVHKNKISTKLKEFYLTGEGEKKRKDPEYKEKQKERGKKAWATEELKLKNKEAQRKGWTTEARSNFSKIRIEISKNIETKEKMSEASKQMWKDPEFRIKVKNSHKKYWENISPEELHFRVGGLIEARENPKLRQAFIEKVSHPVNQFDKQGNFIKTYSSQKEASYQTKVDPTNISDCVNSRTKTAGGFIWKNLD